MVRNVPLNLIRSESTCLDRAARQDLRTLALLISIYCRHRHPDTPKSPAVFKSHDVEKIAGRSLRLCADCRKLLAHSFVKRSACPMDPKPACKNCPQHCYHPRYRENIQEVMRYSGRKLVFSGRLDYLFHLLF